MQFHRSHLPSISGSFTFCLALLVPLLLTPTGCANGGDGEGSPGRDAASADTGSADTGRPDTGTPPPRDASSGACSPACAADEVCRSGSCVAAAPDAGCVGTGVCTPGATETGDACGCGGTEGRACAADCTWGEWSCSGGGTTGECTAGMMDTEMVACGRCDSGTMTRTRTCAADTCSWGPFVDGPCGGESGCVPGDRVPGCDMGSTGTVTTCGEQVCSSTCSLGACQPVPGAACLAGGGSNYQCCTPSGGGPGWQFCDAASCQWHGCAAHSCS